MIITIESEGRRSLFQVPDELTHDKVRAVVLGMLEPGSYLLLEDIATPAPERQRDLFDEPQQAQQEVFVDGEFLEAQR